MDKLTSISKRVADTYQAKGVTLKLVSESANATAWYVEPDQTRRANAILSNLRGQISRQRCHSGMRFGLPQGGALITVSEGIVLDKQYRQFIAEARKLYGEFSQKLDEITIPELAEAPPEPVRECDDLVDRFKKKTRKPKATKERIQEALDGLATADNIQPEQSIKALFRAMRDSGLLKSLPAAGIKWHVPANKHSITFLRDKIPVLQLNLADLNDDAKLAEVLFSLEAMSSGEAPQANQVTADYIKELAKKMRTRESQLQQLAAKHAPGAIQQAKQEQMAAQLAAQQQGAQATPKI